MPDSLRSSGWRARIAQLSKHRIASAMMTVAVLNLVAKLGVTGKDLAVAHRFGTQDALDAFLVAYAIPTFATTVICGSFNSALIPTLILARESEGRGVAQRLFANVMGFTIGILACTSVVLGVMGRPVLASLGSAFHADKLALTHELFLLLLPTIILSGIGTIWGAVLNSDDRFALPAIAPILSPVFIVVGLIVTPAPWTVHGLALGTTLGAAVETVLLGAAVSRLGFPLVPRWSFGEPFVRRVLRQYAPMVAGALVMSSSTLVNQALAGMLGQGSVAALTYGGKLASFIGGLGALSLGTVVLPQFSRMAATRDFDGLRVTLRRYTLLGVFVLFPLTAGLVALSTPIVALLFQRGAFTAQDTELVGRVQAYFLLQLPFYVLGTLFVRVISAFGGNQILFGIASANLVVSVSLTYLLMRVLGVAGIALATSLVLFFAAAVSGWVCTRMVRRSRGGDHPLAQARAPADDT